MWWSVAQCAIGKVIRLNWSLGIQELIDGHENYANSWSYSFLIGQGEAP